MDRLKHKIQSQAQRKARARARIRGTSDRPRLSVHISLHNVSAQIINDESHSTLAAVSTAGNKQLGPSLTGKAAFAGTAIAKKATAKKITRVVLDRGSKLYHGRVKAFAEAARSGGLEF